MIGLLKKYYFVFCLLVSSCAPAIAFAIDVDQETKDLIVQSISLEMVHNPSLKDPYDSLPLSVDYNNLVVSGMSVQFDFNDSSKLVTYQVSAMFESVGGEQGSILCSAQIRELADQKSPERATCYINSNINSNGINADEDEGILIDEI